MGLMKTLEGLENKTQDERLKERMLFSLNKKIL